jgi:hypothetical protein
VGLSKDPATVGHLCCCKAAAVTVTGVHGGPPASKLSKEKLFSEDPAETHVGATLLYTGGAEFCLVYCVSIEKGKTIDPEAGRTADLKKPRNRIFAGRRAAAQSWKGISTLQVATMNRYARRS